MEISNTIDARIMILSLFKWLDVLGILWVVGLLGFWVFVLKPSLKSQTDSHFTSELGILGRQYFSRLLGIGILYLLTISVVGLAYRTATMSGGAVWKEPNLWNMILFKTQIGWIWFFKIGVLLSLGSICLLRPFKWREELALGLGLLLCLSASLTGHALDFGFISLLLAADWIHVIAVALWIGGLVQLIFFARPLLFSIQQGKAHELLTSFVKHFSRLAVTCVALLIITGIYGTSVRIPNLATFFDTLYGLTASAKLVFVGLTVGMGGVSRFYILPGLRHLQSEREQYSVSALKLRKHFFSFIMVEVLLAVFVLTCAALLTQAPPPYLFADE